MRIDNDPKLDFSDVLIRPKRSTLSSRKSVDLSKMYTFHNSQKMWNGIPIIAANMDHTGTIKMALALEKHGVSAALHKHYPVEKLVEFFNTNAGGHWYSMGIAANDIEKFNAVKEQTTIRNVCVDVANGYSERFAHFIKQHYQP